MVQDARSLNVSKVYSESDVKGGCEVDVIRYCIFPRVNAIRSTPDMYLSDMCAKDTNVGHPGALHPFSPARPLIKTPTLAHFNTHLLSSRPSQKPQ